VRDIAGVTVPCANDQIPGVLKMKTVKVRCFSGMAQCGNARKRLFFTLADFGDSFELYTHVACRAIFAIDEGRGYYSHQPFLDLARQIDCLECHKQLADVAKYPNSFVCDDGTVSSFTLTDGRYPPDSESQVLEIWDALQ
jgi:hypothetical protein